MVLSKRWGETRRSAARRSPYKPCAPEGEGRFACNYVCLLVGARSPPPPPLFRSLFPLMSARPIIPGSIKIPGGHDRSPSEIRVRLRPSSTSRRGPAYRFSDRRRRFFLLFREVPLTTRLVRFRKRRRRRSLALHCFKVNRLIREISLRSGYTSFTTDRLNATRRGERSRRRRRRLGIMA